MLLYVNLSIFIPFSVNAYANDSSRISGKKLIIRKKFFSNYFPSVTARRHLLNETLLGSCTPMSCQLISSNSNTLTVVFGKTRKMLIWRYEDDVWVYMRLRAIPNASAKCCGCCFICFLALFSATPRHVKYKTWDFGLNKCSKGCTVEKKLVKEECEHERTFLWWWDWRRMWKTQKKFFFFVITRNTYGMIGKRVYLRKQTSESIRQRSLS